MSLVKKYIDSCRIILNKEIKCTKCESAADGRFFAKKGISCVMMNAKGNNMHGDNEYIELDSLKTLYDIYVHFLKKDNL